jgi:hypothetical protein
LTTTAMPYTATGDNGPAGTALAGFPNGFDAPLNPTQRRVLDELLAIRTEHPGRRRTARPTMPTGLPRELAGIISAAADGALSRWTEPRLWLTKAQLFTALRCEGQLLNPAPPVTGRRMHTATVAGILTHRAIPLSYTHPGRPADWYVKAALNAVMQDEEIAAFWNDADPGTQSDLILQSTSRVVGFLDSWPVLQPEWSPRFEEPIQAKLGKLTLSSRADLILGRPRSDGTQSMFLCDLKNGALRDDHFDEAMFYALVVTLRHGVAPFRSTVFSLASGEYTDPDVTPDRLIAIAHKVADAVGRIVDVRTERRLPLLVAGPHCQWCPQKRTCPDANPEAAGPGRDQPAPQTLTVTPTAGPVADDDGFNPYAIVRPAA